ncbi:E4 [Human papillomavirus 172]|uniref:E4 n=1 Tax=Human papillomavirus 172 TaxID=1434987 RepID=V5W3F1_9PAPI|nr:E4 [Human papillomavirus 172]AHC00348.1 E4 [Human papillomavirus 172]
MPTHMVPQENGQCILTMNTCLLFLLAPHKTPSPDLFKGPTRDLSAPPRTPFPYRKPQDDKKAKREELAQPPRPHLRYDDDDDEHNKENVPPLDRNDDDWKKTLVQHLLEKWAAELTWYQEEVLRDLSALRQKLGIPSSF